MYTEYRDEEDQPAHPTRSGAVDAEDDVGSQDGNLHIRNASESSGNEFPIPIWMRESAKAFRYRWVPLPLRKAGRLVLQWMQGPSPPRVLRIKPFYHTVQEAPLRFMDKYLPRQRHRLCLLLTFYAIWSLTWSLMLKHNTASGHIEGYGRPANIWCGASFWNDGNGCRLNGNGCRPFSSAHMTFRCPANCMGTKLLDPHVVGNYSYVYQGLVIGGADPSHRDSTPIYRADSFICQAAIHAGVITDSVGGCGVATLTGTHPNFQSSESNFIQSVGFPASFPRTFTFQTLSPSQTTCPMDSRWPLFAVTATALVLLWLLSTSPATLFFSTFFILSLHVGLVADPPNSADFHELLSTFCSRLLPASFVAAILYRYCAVPALSGLTAQIEKTFLYLGFCFVGALNNYTFASLIPIQRLTPHDIKSQPGAPIALGIIVSALFVILISQIHYIRVSGQMPRYLRLYGCLLSGLLILLLLPGWRLRIHHYILALLFMPGTAMQTRPSIAYQGLLLGLFINGTLRWGFASIIETPTALGEAGGGHGGSWWGATSPNVTATVGEGARNITFRWGEIPEDRGVDGVSILVGDVERWRGYVDEELWWDRSGVTLPCRREKMLGGLIATGLHVQRDQMTRVEVTGVPGGEDGLDRLAAEDKGEGQAEGGREPQFYRFAWMNGNSAGRYGDVGLWDENGVWWPPKPPVLVQG